MPWFGTVLLALAWVLLGLLVLISLAYGVWRWRNHRQLTRRRRGDGQARVAEIRTRTGVPGQSRAPASPTRQHRKGGERRERPRTCALIASASRPGVRARPGRHHRHD